MNSIHTHLIKDIKAKHSLSIHYNDKRKNFRKISFIIPFGANGKLFKKKERKAKIKSVIKSVNKKFSCYSIHTPATFEKNSGNYQKVTIRINH